MPPMLPRLPETSVRVQTVGDVWYRWARGYDQSTGELGDGTGCWTSYRLDTAAGVEVIDDTATTLVSEGDDSSTGYAYVQIAWPAALVPGAYRETWSHESLPPIVVDVYVTAASIVPPFTAADVQAAHPDMLARTPRGQASWMPQLQLAERIIGARLVARADLSHADVWSSFRLYEHYYATAVGIFLRAVAGGSAAILATAADWDARAETAWPWRLEVDTDGDGAVDETMSTTADDEGSPPVYR